LTEPHFILANYRGLIDEVAPLLNYRAMEEHFESAGVSILAVGGAESSAPHPCRFIPGGKESPVPME
jgi:hypothetical protein